MNRAGRQREHWHSLACGVADCLLRGKTLAQTGQAMGISQSLAHRVRQRLEAHFGTDDRDKLRDALMGYREAW